MSLASFALFACHAQAPQTAAELARLKPGDSREATLYRQSCRACHATPQSGAPLVHDHAAWDARWDKGIPVLLNHTIVGFQAMPAGGQCAHCTVKDYEALIRFMADREKTR